jgi:hypothetical protein
MSTLSILGACRTLRARHCPKGSDPAAEMPIAAKLSIKDVDADRPVTPLSPRAGGNQSMQHTVHPTWAPRCKNGGRQPRRVVRKVVS